MTPFAAAALHPENFSVPSFPARNSGYTCVEYPPCLRGMERPFPIGQRHGDGRRGIGEVARKGLSMFFRDRKDAGKQLAEKLLHYRYRADAIVLGLPRGGVTVAYEIARALHCPLDILIVRKIGFPGNPELAAGAVSETGTVVLNEEIVS